MPSKLPLRPKSKRYDLTEAELRCLRNVVAFGEDKKEMYAAFVRPDLVTSPALLKKYADQFFAQTDTRNFMSDYGKLLDGVKEEREAESSAEPKTREERVANAVDKFTDKVVDKMSGVLDSVEEMDAIAKLADRVGVLAEKDERVEQPRRYLPERCSECKYKVFVEENIKKGNIVDDENN